MQISRRDFLKVGAASVAGAVILNQLSALPSLALPKFGDKTATRLNQPKNDKPGLRFIVDNTKCIGCGKCIKACKLENNVALEPEFNRTWVERYTITEDDEVFVDSPNAGIDGFAEERFNLKYQGLAIQKSFFVPKLCNQCEKPPCVGVCPVGATYVTDEGIVLVNRNACIGCRYCIQACPYGARFFDPRLKVVDKCTWCYHRITKGLLPACVEVCPVGARQIGDSRDSNSAVSQIIKKQAIGTLKPSLGTEPRVYYVGLEKGVQ